MQAAQHLIEIRIAVQSRDKKKLKKALNDLDDSQLLKESIEPDVFAIYEWLLSDPMATAAPGVERIFTNFIGDIHKYSQLQIAQMVNIFDQNQSKYVQQMLRHAAADFTARQYDSRRAFELFRQWGCRDNSYSRHMALVGAEVLLMSARAAEIGAEKEVRELWSSLQNK